MVKRVALPLLSAAMLLFCGLTFAADGSTSSPSPDTSSEQSKGKQRGFTWYERFGVSTSSDGQFMEVTSRIGYNFSKLLGVAVGIPIYFVQPPSSLAGGSSTAALSNVYADMRLTIENPLLRSISTFTATAPSGNTSAGLSTGRATFNWDNRFERSVGRFTPFIDLGVGNTLADHRDLKRPYITLGKVAHLEGGSDVDLWGPLSLSLSGYADVPWGQQRIFSRVVQSSATSSTVTPAPSDGTPPPSGGTPPSGGGSGRGTSSRPNPNFRPGATRPGLPRKGGFETDPQTVGGPDLSRDNGATASLNASIKGVDLDLGYIYSAPFHLNTISFGIGFDLTPVIRRVRGK